MSYRQKGIQDSVVRPGRAGSVAAALIEQFLRSVAACLATPFLLLATLAIGCWLRVLGVSRPPDG